MPMSKPMILLDLLEEQAWNANDAMIIDPLVTELRRQGRHHSEHGRNAIECPAMWTRAPMQRLMHPQSLLSATYSMQTTSCLVTGPPSAMAFVLTIVVIPVA